LEDVTVARQSARPADRRGHKSNAAKPEAATAKSYAHDAPAMANGEWFHRFASETARLAGRPIAFSLAVLLLVIWGLSGPLFGFSDTWQLVINTGTTIVTFLMVFLIQHTQNRDALAFQVKLAELIIAVRGAENKIAAAEEMSDDELEALHKTYSQRASETLESLKARRAGGGTR
jgi:low affinity Fe/Cu permease